MSSGILEAPVIQPTSTAPDDCKHLVDQDAPGNCSVTEAMVLGVELTALCGHKFIPHRDDESMPVCKPCMEMLNVRGIAH